MLILSVTVEAFAYYSTCLPDITLFICGALLYLFEVILGGKETAFFFIFSTLLHMYLRTFCSYFFKHTNISSVYNLSFCSKTLCPLVIYVFPELWCSYHYSNKCARQVRMHATTFSTGGFASSTLNRRAKKMTLKRSFTNLHEL